jgi:hypothetical protein
MSQLTEEEKELGFKQYELTEYETNLLIFVNNHLQAIFSGILSTIASSRLSIKVTDHMEFKIGGDYKTLSVRDIPTVEPTGVKVAE